MERETPLIEGEIYHVFNRGAHKQPIFLDDLDKRRFQNLLYLANTTEPIVNRGRTSVFGERARDAQLVDIFAYALMSNHFHIVMRQVVPQGITNFMRKLCTGYSMYFNVKHQHSGTLFQGKFKSSHIDNDPYFNWIFAYVHLNPIAVIEPGWETSGLVEPHRALEYLRGYRYASFYDYYGNERPERSILMYKEGKAYVEHMRDPQSLLQSYSGGRALYISAG